MTRGAKNRHRKARLRKSFDPRLLRKLAFGINDMLKAMYSGNMIVMGGGERTMTVVRP